jgi:O-antigen/teichoic acid export membrane protein
MRRETALVWRTVRSSIFLRSSFVYLSGSALNAALPLLLMPVMTRYLTPTDYGVVGTATMLVQCLTLVVGLNTSGLIVGSEFERDRERQRRLVSTNVLLACGSASVLMGVALTAGPAIEWGTRFPSRWAPVVVLLSLGAVLQTVFLGLLQARHKAAWLSGLQCLATSSNLGVSVLLVVMLGFDWRGRLLALLASTLLLSAVSLYGLVVRMRVLGPVFDRTSLGAITSFGVPLVPHFVGGLAMTLGPRLYLNHLASVADTGLYSVGLSVASPIALVAGAANQAYMPALFERLSRPEVLNRPRLCRILLAGATALVGLALVYSLVAWLALPLLVGTRFRRASGYILWLTLASAAQGVYFIFGNFVVFAKRTGLMAWRTDFLGGLALLAATPALIWLNGPVGAAQGTFLAAAVSCAGCIAASRRAYPMPWRAALASIGGPRTPIRPSSKSLVHGA